MKNQKEWKYAASGCEGDISLFGVKIFDYKWERTFAYLKIHDPMYGQEFNFPVYRVMIDNQYYEFAAGEFSNGIWGFYILE